jgi:hypothetical protein
LQDFHHRRNKVIYFIRGETTGNIKIGYTGRSAESRLRGFQVGCSERLSVLAVMPGDKATERKLHRQFRSLCVHGEWHRPEERLLRFIADPRNRVPERLLPYIEDEPELLVLLEEVLAMHERAAALPRFCANEIWYGRGSKDPASLRYRMQQLVGWKRLLGPPSLCTMEAYDAAYRSLYDSMPGCRNCICTDSAAAAAMIGFPIT